MSKHYNVITHDGDFHADEIFSIALLKHFYCNIASIQRTRDQNILNNNKNKQDTILVDVGEEYNPELLLFDHHQSDCHKYWLDQAGQVIPMSSTGLVFEFLLNQGYINISSKYMIDYIKNNYIIPIDAADNQKYDFDKGLFLMDFNKKLANQEQKYNQFLKSLKIADIMVEDMIDNALESETEMQDSKEIIKNKAHYKNQNYNQNYKVVFSPLDKIYNQDYIKNNSDADFIINERSENVHEVRCINPVNNNIINETMLNHYKKSDHKWAGEGTIRFIHKNGKMSVIMGQYNDAIAFIDNIIEQNKNKNDKCEKCE